MDTLELGRYLVRELGFSDGVDTLGRWMSHHIAELIDRSNNEPTEARRRKAQREASAAILKIWEHRRVLPGRADPIRRYTELLRFLDLVRPDSASSPFIYFRDHGESASDALAAEFFEACTRLLGVLLFMKLDEVDAAPRRDARAAHRALEDDERALLTSIQSWSTLVGAEGRGKGKSRRKASSERLPDLPKLAESWLDQIQTVTPKLRAAVKGSTGRKSME